MFKFSKRITSSMTCAFTGHAHCKKVIRKTEKGPVLDHIIHYINGCRHIENFPS